jgi:hypothetical protein
LSTIYFSKKNWNKEGRLKSNSISVLKGSCAVHECVPTVSVPCPGSKRTAQTSVSVVVQMVLTVLGTEAREDCGVTDPGTALEMHEQGCRELAAGSCRTPFFQTQRKNHSSHPERVWCCGAFLGGHREGYRTNSPFCGMSLC